MAVRLRPNAFSTVAVRGDTKLGIIVEEVNDTIVTVHCGLPVTTEHPMCHAAIIRVHNVLFITVKISEVLNEIVVRMQNILLIRNEIRFMYLLSLCIHILVYCIEDDLYSKSKLDVR